MDFVKHRPMEKLGGGWGHGCILGVITSKMDDGLVFCVFSSAL